MTSVIGSEYIAPPLEGNPEALLEAFNEYMEAHIEGWKASDGQVDARTGGAGAFIIAQLMEASGDAATGLFRYFGANIANIPPKEANAASGTATWVLTDTAGHTIEAGTVAVWVDGLGNRWSFETLEEVIVAAGKKEATAVAMRASEAGTGSNNLSGAATELATPLSFVSSVTWNTATAGGTAAEEDAVYLQRLRELFRILTPKPIVPEDFNIFLVKEEPGVGRATTLRGFNPTAEFTTGATVKLNTSKTLTKVPAATQAKLVVGSVLKAVAGAIPAETEVIELKPGTEEVILSKATEKTEEKAVTFIGLLEQAGYTTSWITSAAGLALSGGEVSAIEAAVQAKMLAGVVFKCLSPTYTKIKVKATIKAWTGSNTSVVKSEIESAVSKYLSPENWGKPPTSNSEAWQNEPRVRFVNLEAQLLQSVGVHFISSLELNGAGVDVVMPGVVALPELIENNITVEIG